MTNYRTPKAFLDLFYDFTGHAHADYPANQRSIGQDLARCLAQQSSAHQQGPLVVANSVGIYIYSGEEGHPLIDSAEYRAAPNSGFYEMTSLSHVGPAIAYLGVLHRQKDACWEHHIDPLIAHLRAIKTVNAAPMEQHWLTQLVCPTWEGKETSIQHLFDYGCSLAGNYLAHIRDNKDAFCQEHIVSEFLDVQSQDYPIPFNTVMIATFALIGLKGVQDLYLALSNEAIDWSSAKVLLHNLAGTNYGAGMTAGSNWLYPAITSITDGKLDPKRVIIAPYARLPEDIGQPFLSQASFDNLANRVWGSIYARPIVTEEAFSHVDDINIPYRAAIPGDYAYTRADQIEHFVRRLKFSTGNMKEMLSNTVGFWLAGEAKAKDWQFTHMDIPGLTHGLPEGIDAYPAFSPDIRA